MHKIIILNEYFIFSAAGDIIPGGDILYGGAIWKIAKR